MTATKLPKFLTILVAVQLLMLPVSYAQQFSNLQQGKVVQETVQVGG